MVGRSNTYSFFGKKIEKKWLGDHSPEFILFK